MLHHSRNRSHDCLRSWEDVRSRACNPNHTNRQEPSESTKQRNQSQGQCKCPMWLWWQSVPTPRGPRGPASLCPQTRTPAQQASPGEWCPGCGTEARPTLNTHDSALLTPPALMQMPSPRLLVCHLRQDPLASVRPQHLPRGLAPLHLAELRDAMCRQRGKNGALAPGLCGPAPARAAGDQRPQTVPTA